MRPTSIVRQLISSSRGERTKCSSTPRANLAERTYRDTLFSADSEGETTTS
jgi:hypothetical protein